MENQTPPQAIEVEKTVLGTIILDKTVIDRIITNFSINIFSEKKHKLIAQSIINLYKKNVSIDILTLVDQLKREESLEKIGGVVYISLLTKNIASSSNIDYHIRILQQEALRRNLIKIGTHAVQKSFDETEDIFDVFSEVQIQMDESIKNVINYEIKSVGEINTEVIKQSLHVLNSGNRSGVETGLKMLDNVTNGWQKSDLIILAGRPGMGKTSAVVSMSLHPTVHLDIPILMFSLEMSSEQLVSRMQSFYSDINVSKIVKKQLSDEDIITIERKTKDLQKAPLFIDDTPNISLLDLKGKVRKMVKENNIQMVIIDYLQLMRCGFKTQSREQEIAEISRGLKSLAKEQNIAIIALSQLSRLVEQRGGDKKPMLSDLRESGSIEQDADMVIFCYRPEYYGIETYEVGSESFDTNGLFMLLIAKHRNGELGEIPLKFIHEQTKITNYDNQSFTFSTIDSTLVQSNNEESFQENKAIKPNNEFDISDIVPF